jgi:hypothetical protein
MPPLSHLHACATPKAILYNAHSLVTVASYPDLFRILTFHVPNLKSLFN